MMPLLFKATPPAVQPSADLFNRTDFLTSDIPASGTLTARAVARLYAALLGEVDGVRLISPARLCEIAAGAVDDVDQVFGNRVRMSLGYVIGRPLPNAPDLPALPDSSTVFCWSGAGGSHASADTSTGIAFALTKNRLTSADSSTVAQVAAIVTKSLGEG
jgi:hypothetical protein